MPPRPTGGWLGTGPWFAWWHPPAGGGARAAALLLPSMGAEQMWAYKALVVLAERLAASGIAVLRLDWVGTGNSAGDVGLRWDAGHLATTVREAIEALQATGAPVLVGVGFRFGALLLSEAAGASPLHGIVLWDPPPTGRRWVRAQQAVGAVASITGADDHDRLVLPGFAYHPDAKDDLSRLRLRPVRAGQRCHLLVAGEADSSALGTACGATTTTHVESSDPLLYADDLPVATIDALVAATGAGIGARSAPLSAPALSPELRLPGGTTERTVAIGTAPLHVVSTTPAGGLAAGRPVIFVGTANEPSWGPGRLWVRLARQLAAEGRPAHRVDLSGIADSPARVGSPRFRPYHAAGPNDLAEVVAELCPQPPDLVGSCSGAYNSLEAAARADVHAVLAVNPVLDAPADLAEAGTQRLVASPRRHLVDRLRTRLPAPPPASLPPWTWRLLDELRVQRSPASGLPVLAARGTKVVLICGDDDSRRYEHRSKWIIDRLRASGALAFEHVAHLDHALLAAPARAQTSRRLEHHLRAG